MIESLWCFAVLAMVGTPWGFWLALFAPWLLFLAGWYFAAMWVTLALVTQL